MLANRPRPELEQLAARLHEVTPELRNTVVLLSDKEQTRAAAQEAHIIVNATSLGLSEDDPLPIAAELLCEGHVVFDLITHDTPLQRAAREKGCMVCDGRDMLLGQGALSFEKWFGRPADTAAMRAALFKAADA